MIAAITLRFLDPFGTGKLVLFQVTYDKASLAHEWICRRVLTISTWLNFAGLARV